MMNCLHFGSFIKIEFCLKYLILLPEEIQVIVLLYSDVKLAAIKAFIFVAVIILVRVFFRDHFFFLEQSPF